MITVSCKECGKKYEIDPAQIKGTEAKFRCKSCNNMVVVTLSEPEEINQSDLMASNPRSTAKKSRGNSFYPATKPSLLRFSSIINFRLQWYHFAWS